MNNKKQLLPPFAKSLMTYTSVAAIALILESHGRYSGILEKQYPDSATAACYDKSEPDNKGVYTNNVASLNWRATKNYLSSPKIASIHYRRPFGAPTIFVPTQKQQGPVSVTGNDHAIHIYTAKEKQGWIGETEGKQIDIPSDNIFYIQVDKAPGSGDKVWLDYELKGVEDASSVARSINDRLSVGAMIVKHNDTWSEHKELINPLWINSGENHIRFCLPKNARYGYTIKNVSLSIKEQQLPSAGIGSIEITQQVVYGTTAYIKGFLRGANTPLTTLFLDGKPVKNQDGEFEALVENYQPGSVSAFEVVTPGGFKEVKGINWQTEKEADWVYNADMNTQRVEAVFVPQTTQSLQLAGCSLEIKKGALKQPTTLSMIQLRVKDMAALEMGMVNVTAGASGYRIKPVGQKLFDSSANISLGFDKSKLPEGYSEADIHTYYFDNTNRQWVMLAADSIDVKGYKIYSRLSGGGDMINGVLKAPESPETQGYVPTMMSGIKAADPAAAIQLIAPPGANQSGSAAVGYSIEVPPGRQGMQPQLGVSYNSDGGDGWMGEGWTLGMSSITVETRWGVPRYNASVESETYNMGGSMLAMIDGSNNPTVAHRNPNVARKSERQFYPRREGNFAQTIRHGGSPSTYYWEVTDKGGNKFFYGGVTGMDAAAVLRDPATGDIAEWMLVKEIDVYGNYVSYTYDVTDNAIAGSLTGRNIYLKHISYTGFGGSDGPFEVTLYRQASSTRKDKNNNARYGFLTQTADLLDSVVVSYNSAAVRSYKFNYTEGAFYKTLLTNIIQYTANGAVLEQHDFEYYKDAGTGSNYNPFKNAENWNPQSDYVHGKIINPAGIFNDKISALGGGQTNGAGFNVGVGVGVNDGKLTSKSLTIGGQFGYTNTKSTGLLSMIDINGDGLPDKVWKENGALYYRPNLSAAQGASTTFGNKIQITGINDFAIDKSDTRNYGTEINGPSGALSTFVGADFSNTNSSTKTYFTDVNGDGLVDIVSNSVVYFNSITKMPNGDLVPVFSASSNCTPSPLRGVCTPIDGGAYDMSPQDQDSLSLNSPLHETVRVWEAPYSGTISINAPMQASAPANATDYPNLDGLRVAIQKNGTELWNTTIAKNDYSVKTPSNVSNFAIAKGDKIYFRQQVGTSDLSNGEYDIINWDPEITYGNYNAADTDRDVFNRNQYRYKSSEDWLVSNISGVMMPQAGTIHITGNLVLPAMADSIRIAIIVDGNAVWTKSYAPTGVDQLINTTIDLPGGIAVNERSSLQCNLWASENVQINAVQFIPTYTYTGSAGLSPTPFVPNYLFSQKNIFQGSYYQLPATDAYTISPLLSFTNMAAANGTILFTVRKGGTVIGTQLLTVSNGLISTLNPGFAATLNAGDRIFASFEDNSGTLTPYIATAQYSVSIQPVPLPAPAVLLNTSNAYLYSVRTDPTFGPMYRGWGQFVYNGMAGRATAAIDESLLKIPDSQPATPIQPKDQVYFPMLPDISGKWMGMSNLTYISRDTMRASRLGQNDVVLTNPLAEANKLCSGARGGAIGVDKTSSSKSRSFDAGGGIGPISGSAFTSTGSSKILTDFSDMNGDRYPDILTDNKIQYTTTLGSLEASATTHGLGMHSSTSSAGGISASGGFGHAETVISKIATYLHLQHATKQNSDADHKAIDGAHNNKGLSLSLNASASDNSDEAEHSWLDVNGDGLPDKVYKNGNVQLNLGYTFAAQTPWGLGGIMSGSSKTYTGGGGAAFSTDNMSIYGGVGLSLTQGNTTFSLQDMNGDQLVDKVEISGAAIYVSLNNGSGFEAPVNWAGLNSISTTSSTGEDAGAGFTYGFTIPPLVVVKFRISAGVSINAAVNRTPSTLEDMDGDGFVDYVSSSDDATLMVQRSTIARTNKLKTVNRPLGGSYTLDYAHSAATYDHPNGKWVLSSVELNDGLADDGKNMLTRYQYDSARYDRDEREFLGFGKVTAMEINTDVSNTTVYSKHIQLYDVSNYYVAGNPTGARVEDANGNKYTETATTYYNYSVTPNANTYTKREVTSFNPAVCNAPNSDGIGFTPAKYNKTTAYEGGSSPLILSESKWEYNTPYGNISRYLYSDKGGLGANGSYDYQTSISYTDPNTGKHILGLPNNVSVTDVGGTIYRKVNAVYNTNGEMTRINATLNTAGNMATSDITYDKYGNVIKKEMPANYKGKRMSYTYRYETDLNQYIERIQDAYGYTSRVEQYDYVYGMPLQTQDINGQSMTYALDEAGRIVSILAPNESAAGKPYTLNFEYHPLPSTGGAGGGSYAITNHYDPQHPGDDLQTITFIDGYNRPVQVKKEGIVAKVDYTTGKLDGANPLDSVWLLSGRVKYDGLGRAASSYYPTTEPTSAGTAYSFNPQFDIVQPTKTQYDVLDRAVKITLPDNTISLVAHTISTDADGNRRLQTRATDALGNKKESYTNGSGLTTSLSEYGPAGIITTKYSYDPIQQLLQVIDTRGNTTSSTFDLAGRRIQMTHPDAGTTNITYDNAGLLLKKQTANLGITNEYITYDYDFTRLTNINYPDNPQNNVRYTYGNKDALYGRVGRAVLQEDATGAQEFYYGRQGELTKNVRTLIVPNNAESPTFVTSFEYDSWDRLQSLTYPDGEKVSYSYNTAGMLTGVSGSKTFVYNYVNTVGYDKFEQRTYLRYCNGSEMVYNYDAQRRRLAQLQAYTGTGLTATGTRRQFMKNTYTYDAVSNILNITNTAPTPDAATGFIGGVMNQSFSYDKLYRLSAATGAWAGQKLAMSYEVGGYTLSMSYDDMHNITSKTLVNKKGWATAAGGIINVANTDQLYTGYTLNYTYNPAGKPPHQLDSITDNSYRSKTVAGITTTANKKHRAETYSYDANGNLTYKSIADTAQPKINERKLLWDEENRLKALDDNGFVSYYMYDAGGERTLKMSGQGEGVYINTENSGARTGTNNFMLYVNPYIVIRNGNTSVYTKHIYMGGQRIVSKMGDSTSYGADPRRIPKAGDDAEGGIKPNYAAKFGLLNTLVKAMYDTFRVPYAGSNNSTYAGGQGFCCGSGQPGAGSAVIGGTGDNVEKMQYYYHPDHLGSTSFITNLDGEVAQYLEYLPFGETFMEKRLTNYSGTPYQFNGKELDAETNLYYYGARYYDPVKSLWISVDPLAGYDPIQNTQHYIDGEHNGGVYNSGNLNVYGYCYQNPIVYFDPNGKQTNFTKAKVDWDQLKINYVKDGQKIVGEEGKKMAFLKGQNTCAIKLSYTLNKSGYIIPEKVPTQKRSTQSGSKDRDGKAYNYILGSNEMGAYLKDKLGKADYVLMGVTQDNYKDFVKKIEAVDGFKGFIYFKANDQDTYGAQGHVDLIYNEDKFFGGQEARVYGSDKSLSKYLDWNSDPGWFWNTDAKLDVYVWQIKPSTTKTKENPKK